MADEAREYQVTVPAGTTAASPLVQAIVQAVRVVERIDWHVAPGSLGVMGWRLTMGGVQVLPTAGVAWKTVDSMSGYWQVKGLPDSGGWEVTAYNTGAHDHTLFLTVHMSVPSKPPVLRPRLAPGDLAEVPDLSHAGRPLGEPLWPF